ncbi:LytTR family DNA-binding domain-containing protein [Pseudoroseicyclus tamaricis]|uniref:LytTR family transcriptional regulator n=1 Tax=Pseudoroseicyclus tamaricis TaxID=2705421 RepID=A0A6B2K329_9RHOB|nr:LytTR family DNA-binding domain-containing protein [Pseudoroseicyclus tamaricis]NDV02212.1 LytTR family transcriptional regulator [Pseudoroseicyclus tamaricis]
MNIYFQKLLRPLYWDGRTADFSWSMWLPILLAVSAVLGVSGPFGTYSQFELVPRLLFYKLAILSSAPVAWGASRGTARILPRLGAAPMIALRAAIFAAATTPIFVLVYRAFDPWMIGIPPGWGEIALKSLLIGLGLFALQRAIRDAVPQASSEAPRLLARLPGHEGGRVWRLSADDHYTQVLIDGREEERLLMRFSDAVAEMDCVEGLLVHRSHWVAREAIREARREGGKDVVVLRNGARLPVSRTYREGLEELGFLEPREVAAAAEERSGSWEAPRQSTMEEARSPSRRSRQSR